jgi:two-component system sensor histidine kinase EvgS
MAIPLRVLLVEDSADDAALLLRQLRLGGFDPAHERVDTAEAMAAALDAGGPWDAVIADYVLPRFSGPAALALVRARGLDVPFVVVSGTVSEEVAVEVMRAGAHDYVLKGNLTRLAPAVARELREAEVRRGQRLARQVEAERDRLRTAVAAQERVLGVVSHELRAPLAGIRATAEFLLTDGPKDAVMMNQFLRAIHDEAIRMSGMVSGMLEVARMNSGAAHWNWGEVAVARACDEALVPVRALVDRSKVSLALEVSPPDGPAMRGDADAIRRLVLNLASNAAKFTEEGSVRVRASAAASDDQGAWVEIEVRDTGRGMTPETAARLGEAFALNTAVVGDGPAAGVGLGLAICRGIVAAHGGTISVASAPGRGTTVTARLRADLPEPVRDVHDGPGIGVVSGG